MFTPCVFCVLPGYYQNEKVFEEEPDDHQETDSMLSPRSRRGGPTAVANPEYFSPGGEGDVWQAKGITSPSSSASNGPNGPNGPNGLQQRHLPSSPSFPAPPLPGGGGGGGGHSYYNDFSNLPPPPPPPPDHSAGSRLLIRDRLPSESQV